MSWPEKLSNGIIITTGDGKVYEPIYSIAARDKEYNVSEFDFVNISGTLVKRSQPRGRRYNFELTFQGENHLDVAESFDKSADDPRPWTVSHPFYGQLLIQPINLKHDPTGLNTSIFTGEFIETISEEYPKIGVNPTDKGKEYAQNFLDNSIDRFVNEVDLSTETAAQMRNDVNSNYSLGAANVDAGDLSNDYYQLFNNTQAAINNLSADASLAATQMSTMIFFPYSFGVSVKTRLNLLVNQYLTFATGLDELVTPNQKKVFEMNAGTSIAAMIQSALTPLNSDYLNAPDVIDVIDIIIDNFNGYVGLLNGLQTINNGLVDSYVPDYDSISQLNLAVNYTLSNLMDIAMGAKKARHYISAIDTNVILLAHRFYGLSNEMDNVQKLMDENNIDLPEVLQIKAGREIVYYI